MCFLAGIILCKGVDEGEYESGGEDVIAQEKTRRCLWVRTVSTGLHCLISAEVCASAPNKHFVFGKNVGSHNHQLQMCMLR